jgi:amidase
LQRFTRDKTQLFFDREIAPIGSVKSGEQFQVETADAVCGIIKSERDVFRSFDELLETAGGACPVTGPIFIEGARPGDCIAVNIARIDPAPVSQRGWTTIAPGWGALTHDMGYTLQEPLPPTTSMVEVRDGMVEIEIDGRFRRITATPFMGTVGVAPKQERRMTLSQSREYLGDVDIRSIGVGSTLLLPVNIEGALLSMGDAHAAQGEGEITGIAIEVESDVTVTVEVMSRDEARYGSLPGLEGAGWIGSIAGFMGVSLTSCIRAGYVDLCRRLEEHYGFTTMGAYKLLGQVGRVQVGNMIDPFYSCLVTINREYIE